MVLITDVSFTASGWGNFKGGGPLGGEGRLLHRKAGLFLPAGTGFTAKRCADLLLLRPPPAASTSSYSSYSYSYSCCCCAAAAAAAPGTAPHTPPTGVSGQLWLLISKSNSSTEPRHRTQQPCPAPPPPPYKMLSPAAAAAVTAAAGGAGGGGGGPPPPCAAAIG